LDVIGATSLNGALSVTAAGGSYRPSTTYSILTSTTLSGQFSSVATDLAFLTPAVTYDAQNVYLTLKTPAQPVQFSSVALTNNQGRTADAVQAGGAGSTLYDAVIGQSVDGARTAFTSLSGEAHAGVDAALLDESRATPRAVLQRLRQPLSQDATPGAWGEVFGGWGRINGARDGNTASVSHDQSGLIAGTDLELGEAWKLGLAGAYTTSQLDVVDRDAAAQVETYDLALYAGRAVGPLNVRFGGAYGWSDVDAARSVLFPGFRDTVKANYDALTRQAFGEIGYGFNWRTAQLEPFIGVSYVELKTDGFDETGGAARLTAERASSSLTYSSVGLRASSTLTFGQDGVLTPRMMLAWQRASGDLTPSTQLRFAETGAGFQTTGVTLARDAALVEFGVDWSRGARMTLGVSYRGTLSNAVQDNALAGVFSWSF
jgi:outer membrane autotransporter protein